MTDTYTENLLFNGKFVEAACYEAGKAAIFSRVCPSYRIGVVLVGEDYEGWVRRVIDRDKLPDEMSFAAFARFYDAELKAAFQENGGQL